MWWLSVVVGLWLVCLVLTVALGRAASDDNVRESPAVNVAPKATVRIRGRMMPEDRPYIAANTRQRERLRALVERLDDDSLIAPVNEYWTVAGVLGHIAYWDIRVLVLAEKIHQGEPWAAGDAEPEGDWLNDTTRPLIHAIAPREAAKLAMRTAEEVDTLVASLPLDRMWPGDPDSPINAARGEHRGEHLDEIERALAARG